MLGLFGTLNAQVVTIDGTVGGYEASTSKEVPVYNNYEYAITQQYYTAAEIGKSSGIIESIAFKTTETGTYPFTRSLTIYMVNTSEDNFGVGGKTTKAMADTDVVFEGEVTFAQANAWTTIELTTNLIALSVASLTEKPLSIPPKSELYGIIISRRQILSQLPK